MPIGPAPVTSTCRGCQNARARMAATSSQAFATTVVGSSSTAEEAERRVHLGEVARLDPPSLGHEPVDLLDAPLGVLPVAAHVPFADRAVGTRHRVGASDDPDDQVARLHAAVRPRVQDPAQRLVTQDQTFPPRGRPAVRARGDLDVRPADAHRHRLDQDRPGALVRFGDLLEADRARDPRLNRDCLHCASVPLYDVDHPTGASAPHTTNRRPVHQR